MPLKKNIGVINIVKKLFNVPILGATATNMRANEANTIPVKKATGIVNNARGECKRPNIRATVSTDTPASNDLVAAQAASPITSSSILTGVTIIPSNTL